jgi:hypothetical protein
MRVATAVFAAAMIALPLSAIAENANDLLQQKSKGHQEEQQQKEEFAAHFNMSVSRDTLATWCIDAMRVLGYEPVDQYQKQIMIEKMKNRGCAN